ncbi:unnamed protein product [Prunus armeniaca]
MENFLKGRKRCLKNLEEEKEEKVFEKEKGEEDKGEEEKEENEKGEGRGALKRCLRASPLGVCLKT